MIGLLETGWLHDQLKESRFETLLIQQKRSYDLSCLWNLCSIVRKHKIELIHAHEFMMNVYGTMAGLLTGTPVVATLHGKNYFWVKPRRRIAYRFVSRFSKMVAVSEDLKNFLAERAGVSKNRIITLYNGIDCKTYDGELSPGKIASVKESLSIPPDSPVIGTVGMLAPVKDHETLLATAVRVILERPEAIFLIVGDGPLKDRLKDLAYRSNIEKNVRFTGFRKDIPDLLQIMDVYICSSESEGLSLSILEAMAAGIPIVATNVGGNPEIVLEGETGFLVPTKDPEALASKINLLLNDQLLARKIGENGRQRVYEKFSIEQMVNSYQLLYDKALLKR